jgi:hypothetical protein
VSAQPEFTERQLELIHSLSGEGLRQASRGFAHATTASEKAFYSRSMDELQALVSVFEKLAEADTSQDAVDEDELS